MFFIFRVFTFIFYTSPALDAAPYVGPGLQVSG